MMMHNPVADFPQQSLPIKRMKNKKVHKRIPFNKYVDNATATT